MVSKRKKGKRRSHAQICRDRQRIADLYLQGWLQADIAAEAGVSQATVSRDLKALHAEWLQSALVDFNEAKSRELARIDRLEREYWRAWEESCKDAETIKQKGTPADKTVRTIKTATVERTVRGQAGDPRFLSGVQWCIDRRCKILGLDAPTNMDIDVKSGGKPLAMREVVVKLNEPVDDSE